MNARVLSNTLIFEGVLDEQTLPETLTDALNKLRSSGLKSPVTVDFSSVKYANSTGIVTWLKFTVEANVAFKYVKAPIWLVNQFNSIKDYLENGSFVESLDVPFFAPKTRIHALSP